jgi:hypothetical protein
VTSRFALYYLQVAGPAKLHQSLLAQMNSVGGMNDCVSYAAVAQLVEALRYKPEGCRFDSRWNFSLRIFH